MRYTVDFLWSYGSNRARHVWTRIKERAPAEQPALTFVATVVGIVATAIGALASLMNLVRALFA